jgi:hypothetical protein
LDGLNIKENGKLSLLYYSISPKLSFLKPDDLSSEKKQNPLTPQVFAHKTHNQRNTIKEKLRSLSLNSQPLSLLSKVHKEALTQRANFFHSLIFDTPTPKGL